MRRLRHRRGRRHRGDRRLPDLDDANFARTKLTDAGVNALAAGTKIRQIDARETKVTKEGAERAKMGRVRLEIRVEEGRTKVLPLLLDHTSWAIV